MLENVTREKFWALNQKATTIKWHGGKLLSFTCVAALVSDHRANQQWELIS